MSSKFGNLEDLFDFLELKRAEIEESFRAQMTREPRETELTMLTECEGSGQNTAKIPEKTENLGKVEHAVEAEHTWEAGHTWEAEPIEQLEHIDQLEHMEHEPIASQSRTHPNTGIEMDEYDFDIKMIAELSPARFEQTDTTLIMEQLCLNEDEFDYDPLCEAEETGDEDVFHDISPKDPFDLLSFPMSQFPINFDCNTEADDSSAQEVDDTFIDDDQFDDLLSDFDLMESKGTYDLDRDLDIFDIPMSQFPTTQMMTRSDSVEAAPLQITAEEIPFVGFSTGRGKKLPPPSDEALKKALKLIEFTEEGKAVEAEDLSIKDIKPPSSFGGFSTGRGKELPPPSKEAMKRARSLMEIGDLSEPDDQDDGTIRSIGHNLNTVKETNMRSDTGPSVGFATAKGNKIPPPSKAALDRAKQIIGDVAADPAQSNHSADLVDPPSDFPAGFVGFSTGKGKIMAPPSEAALKRAKLLDDDIRTEPRVTVPPAAPAPATALQKKPFALSLAWKRTRRPAQLLKAPPPPPPKPAVKAELVKLFDLSSAGQQRYNLREFFQQTPNLSISDYDESFGINEIVLKINSENVKDFKFPCGWGAPQAHESLLLCGASSASVNLAWTENHYRWIIWKFASLIRTFPDSYSPANLSPSWTLSQLLYRYEREIHQCHRSALKKIVERDDAAGKYLCLMVSGVDRAKKCVELSDGWYSLWTAPLDAALWTLVENSRIRAGVKIEISGAVLTGQEALPILEASSRDCPSHLMIWRNSCRLARWDTKLGFLTNPKQRAVTFLKHLHQIHPQGGPIPALSLVIDRVFPLLFREERLDPAPAPGGGGSGAQTRNVREHYLYLELHPEQARNSKFTPIQRIRVSNNHPSQNSSCAIISFWNPLGEEQMTLLQEGSAVIITNLRASARPTHGVLSLVSSKSTRLFKDDLKTTTTTTNNHLLFGPNQFTKLKELKVSESIDLAGGIVLGRSGHYFWIGSSDAEEEEEANPLICLSNFTTSMPLSPGDSVNFRDLTFNHFDSREGVVHFIFTEYSDFKKEARGTLSSKKSHNRFIELTK